jgi:PKD repeat protein
MKRSISCSLSLLFLIALSATAWGQSLQWRKYFGPGDFDINAAGTKVIFTTPKDRSYKVTLLVYDVVNDVETRRLVLPYSSLSRAVFDWQDSILFFERTDTPRPATNLRSINADSSSAPLWTGFMPGNGGSGGISRTITNTKKNIFWGGISGGGPFGSSYCAYSASVSGCVRLGLRDTISLLEGRYSAERTEINDEGDMAQIRYFIVYRNSIPNCHESSYYDYVIYDSTNAAIFGMPLKENDRIGPLYSKGKIFVYNDSLYFYPNRCPEIHFPVINKSKFISNNHLLYPTARGIYVRRVLDDSVVFVAMTPDSAVPVNYELNANRTALFVQYADNTIAKWEIDFSTFTDALPRLNNLFASRYSVNENENIEFSLTAYPQTENTQYTWLFGDGTSTKGRDVKHAYEKDGVYTVTCIAEFSSGVVDTMVKKNFIVVRTISPFVKMLTKLPRANTGERATAMRYRQDGKRLLVTTDQNRICEYDAQTGEVIREIRTEGTPNHIAYNDSSSAISMWADESAVGVTKFDLNTSTPVRLAYTRKYVDPKNFWNESGICTACESNSERFSVFTYTSFMSSDDMTVTCGGRATIRRCVEASRYNAERFCSVTSAAQWRKGMDTIRTLFSSFYFSTPTNPLCNNEGYSTFNVAIRRDGLHYTAVESLDEARTTNLIFPRALRVRSTADGSLIKAYLGDNCNVACFNADGTRVITNNFIYNVVTGDSLRVSSQNRPGSLERFNANSGLVVAATSDTAAQIHFIDLETGFSRMNLGRSISSVELMTISPDSKTIATAMRDGSILFWRTPDSLITIQTSVSEESEESEDFTVRSVCPNPAQSEIRVQLVGAAEEEVLPELYDPLGQRVASFSAERCVKGLNAFTLHLSQSLSAGSYVICLRSKRSMKAMPLVIVR